MTGLVKRAKHGSDTGYNAHFSDFHILLYNQYPMSESNSVKFHKKSYWRFSTMKHKHGIYLSSSKKPTQCLHKKENLDYEIQAVRRSQA